jgi:general secretion pathway protein A
MNFKDTRLMIQFRLQQSSETKTNVSLFTYPALWATYRATGGFPRKIVNLCHKSILAMIVQNRSRVGLFLVRSCIKRAFSKGWKRWRQLTTAAFLVGLVMVVLMLVFAPKRLLMRNDISQLKSKETKIEGSLKKVQRNSTQSFQISLNKPSPEPGVKVSTDTSHRKAVKTVPEAFYKTYYKASKYPSILGQVAVKRLETLGGMIQKIYGVFDFRYLYFVKKANPRLNNPDNIDVDDVISFPTIPVKVKPFKENAWWIEIGEKDNLEAAFNLIRSYPKDAPPVRLIPYWDNLLGLKFSVLLKEYFFVETFAMNRLKELPTLIASKGKILSKWDENTVFFANPF